MCPIPLNPNILAIMTIKKIKKTNPLFLKGMETTINLYKQ